MASAILKGLVTNYGSLGYQLWHRPLIMASLVYEREIGAMIPGVGAFALFVRPHPAEFSQFFLEKVLKPGVSPGGWALLELTDA